MAEIVMPRLSDTMEEGTILRWIKSDGEEVARGEELVEIETDKAAMVYEADVAGTLRILAGEGETLPVGAVIARVGDGGAPASADGEASQAAGDGAVAAAAESPAPAATPADPIQAPPPAPAGPAERIRASPLARRIAGERGVDLRSITGTGPGGRIVKADLEQASAGGAPAAAAGAASAAIAGVAMAKGETSVVELSRLQQAVARRMAESKATIPDFALQMDVDMEECVRLRGELKRISRPEAEPRAPTYNDMVVKAAALALREHPRANASYRDGQLQLHSRVNVGVAVAAEEALVVPTVFDADEKSLGEIARETHGLAGRVRAGTITPPELGGGTFTVSNLGMYGIRSFTAIINPPQAAILSVGVLEQRAVVREGTLVARSELTLTLACDHRILYGAEAALFLARVRELLQAPAALSL